MTGGPVRIRSGARLHVGFRNLSVERSRLFGGIGVAIEHPVVSVTAHQARTVNCTHPRASRIAEKIVAHFGIDGIDLQVECDIPRHVGFGSGTQLTLAIYVAIARANGIVPRVREHAPFLGRGGRSGVGIASFESGGFVVDAGHSTEEVVRAGSAGQGVPDVDEHEPIPDEWRFLLVRPSTEPGRSGTEETESIERTIRRADASIADEIERILSTQVLPGVRSDNIARFGRGITRIDALTGTWFQSEQGDRYRRLGDQLISHLASTDAIYGWGQSSWGPLIYALTTANESAAATTEARMALTSVGINGVVDIVAPRNHGAEFDPVPANAQTCDSLTYYNQCQN